MAKKQKSFADKASGSNDKDAVYVKYVNSVKSEKTGHWRFNEQIVKTRKGESLDVALKRLNEAANLVDIDLSEFETTSESAVKAEKQEETVKAEKQEETVKAEKQEETVKAEKQEETVKAENQEETVKAENQEEVVKAEKAKKEDKKYLETTFSLSSFNIKSYHAQKW